MRRLILLLIVALAACKAGGESAPELRDGMPYRVMAVTASQWCEATTVSEISSCIDDVEAHSIGGTVLIKAGLYYPTSTFEINKSNVTIRGEGNAATYINWQPGTSGDPLFHFKRDGSWSVAKGRLSDMYLYQNSASYTGPAIELEDVVDFTAKNVTIHGFTDGIVIYGRDSVTFEQVNLYTVDKPILLGEGATYGGSVDHFVFRDVFIEEDGDDDPIVDISAEMVHSLVFDNGTWVGGSYGIYWPSSAGGDGNSMGIVLRDIRREQNPTTGAFVWIKRASGDWLNNFRAERTTSSLSDGFVLDRVRYPTVVDSTYDGQTSGKVFDNITNATSTKLEQNRVSEVP